MSRAEGRNDKRPERGSPFGVFGCMGMQARLYPSVRNPQEAGSDPGSVPSGEGLAMATRRITTTRRTQTVQVPVRIKRGNTTTTTSRPVRVETVVRTTTTKR